MSEAENTELGYVESAATDIYNEIEALQRQIEDKLEDICNATMYERAMNLSMLYQQMADRLRILEVLDSIETTPVKEETVYRRLIERQNSSESSLLDMMCNLENLHENSCEFIEKQLTKLFK